MKGLKMQGKILASLAIAALLLGCADQRKETKVLKEQVVEKQMISETEDYLYLPSVVDSPRSADATRPYWMGDAKRVRITIAENELVVYEVENDARFADNPTNKKPVFRIPIENVDYKCAEDAYGDCLPTEQENTNVTWSKKRYIKPSFEDVKFQEVNFLPIELTNLFENCYTEKASDFVGYKIEKDAINFTIQKTYQSSAECLGDIESLSDVSFNVRYHYSLVKLSTLATPGYKPFVYSKAEENTFGFFTTRQFEVDVDNNSVERNELYQLNRWSPNRTVVYHLSKEFNKPENAAIKQSSIESFEAINNALKSAGTQLNLVLKDYDPNMQTGDLRNNMIVMVEDPLATGILGYGPSVANPLTGEIVHARTVMYMGNLKKYLQDTYNELVEEKLAEAQSSRGISSTTPRSITLNGASVKLQKSKSSHGHMHLEDLKPIDLVSGRGGDFGGRQLSEKKIREIVSNPTKIKEYSEDFRNRIEVLSRHNAYPSVLFNFHAAIEDDIDEVLKKTQMKPWGELSSGMKKLVVDTLMPFIWKPILIHEVGHNLGLRHNFGGSEDKENFYTDEERARMGIKRKMISSSIMEYMHRTNTELRTMGKYDIAALRYAYAEKAELKDGKLVSLDEMRKDLSALKEYRFCTDEHVDVNPTCKRFDEGSTLTEITQHWINFYEERFKTRNFRNQRLSFSLTGDISQIMFLHNIFRNFRLSFERYESIKNDYDLPDNHAIWEQNPFLKDLKTATLLGGAFLTEILKTPDIICAIVAKAKPNEIVAAIPLRDLSVNAMTCFDSENVGLNPAYQVAAEGGKSYNSLKSPYSTNPYIDQIDIRGIWIDKIMALNTLLERGLGSPTFDEYTENYLHVPELKPVITNVLESILLDKVEGQVPFRTEDGQQLAINFSYPLAAQHVTKAPLMRAVKNFFGFGNEPIPFQHLMVRTIKRLLPSGVEHDKTKDVLESFDALTSPDLGDDIANAKSLVWGTEKFYALPGNKMAAQLINRVNMSVDLAKVDRKALEAAAEKLASDPNAVPANDIEKKVKAYGVEEVISLLSGEVQEPAKMVAVLRELSR